MKRIAALLLALALALFGCTKQEQNGTENAPQNDVQVAETLTGTVETIDEKGLSLSTAPDMPNGQMPQGNPPEMPNGQTPQGNPPDMSNGQMPQGNPPEMPNGQTPQGNPPDMPNGQMPQGNPPDMSNGQGFPMIAARTLTFADGVTFTDENGAAIERTAIKAGDTVTVSLNAEGLVLSVQKAAQTFHFGGPESMGGAPGGPGGSKPDSYTAVKPYSLDAEIADETVRSTGADESAILVENGAIVTVRGCTVTRVSENSTGGDSASFYGVGAALLVTDGSLTVENCTVDTDSAGGAGVFAYGSGTATVRDTEIRTKQGTSGGLHVAGGGTLYAENCTVETDGGSAAAIRSDRGGGTMTVDGGSYVSNGSGSPAVYCTADITVNHAKLCATGSEAVCIEGKNSLTLNDCTLEGNMPDLEQNDCTWTVILYQSMSGDSEVGTSRFSMTGGRLVSKHGGIFYTTNTASEFLLENVEITASDDCPFLLKCTGNKNARGWGRSGANGAQSVFTAARQSMAGDILWDSVSTLSVKLTEGTVWTGAFLKEDAQEGGAATLMIDAGSSWIVTGDSILTSLENRGTIADAQGRTVTVRTAEGEVIAAGDSTYTVTVLG
jgi:hypothetical protein